jgi:hypothetical protein
VAVALSLRHATLLGLTRLVASAAAAVRHVLAGQVSAATAVVGASDTVVALGGRTAAAAGGVGAVGAGTTLVAGAAQRLRAAAASLAQPHDARIAGVALLIATALRGAAGFAAQAALVAVLVLTKAFLAAVGGAGARVSAGDVGQVRSARDSFAAALGDRAELIGAASRVIGQKHALPGEARVGGAGDAVVAVGVVAALGAVAFAALVG